MGQISVGEGAVIGGAVGLITACLGAYKDSPHEGFSMKTFWRSPIIATIYGMIGARAFTENESKVLLAGFSSMAERITTETYKAIVGKKPGKFDWGTDRDRGWLLKVKEV